MSSLTIKDKNYTIADLNSTAKKLGFKDANCLPKSLKVLFENLVRRFDGKTITESHLKAFFNKNGLLLNWKEFEKLNHIQKINTLAMISPITNEEKQKLLESISLENKVNTLDSIISFYLHESGSNSQTLQ